VSEVVNDKKIFSLLEVTSSIRKTISERYQRLFWVKAEMNKLNHYSYSGHCYPELVEKVNGKVVAQMRASLWKEDFIRINENFIRTIKEPLKDGITIVFTATINFDPVHGLSLRIIDVDPVFALGELEREKLETIEKLRAEGIFRLNKSLTMPLLPKRIAVISVETSKGYSDFLNVIDNNPSGYKFFCYLFPALLQGDRSVDSIISQLNRVRTLQKHFDVVAIIRGGGGDVGLSSYNNFNLASAIARFPIPVLTGIGHSTNETVAELVAFKNAITPTELADYLIQKLNDFSIPLQRAERLLVDKSKRILAEQRSKFLNTIRHFRSATTNSLITGKVKMQGITKGISQNSYFLMRRCADQRSELLRQLNRSVIAFANNQQVRLNNTEKTINIMDPVHVIRRGFTITTVNGKVVKSSSSVSVGDQLNTTTADGMIISTVTKP